MECGSWFLQSLISIQLVVNGFFWVKRNVDGNIDRFRARLVARGFHQQKGINFSDNFSPVIKPTTVYVILGIAVSLGWPLRQLDVNNVFLQGHLAEEVYMQQPSGFVDKNHPNYVCSLKKAINGLKQAPRALFHELSSILHSIGFINSKSDSSPFIFRHDGHMPYLLVYVDDIIVIGTNNLLIDRVITHLSITFSLKDLGTSYFLGMEVLPHSTEIFLNQYKYIYDLLSRTNMLDAEPVSTPLCTSASSYLTVLP